MPSLSKPSKNNHRTRMPDPQNSLYQPLGDSGLPRDDGNTADVPRIAQWEEDQEIRIVGDSQGPSRIHALQVDLSDLPLGALRKAQGVFDLAAVDSSDNNYSDGAKSQIDTLGSQDGERKSKIKVESEWSFKSRLDMAKRTSKNAPTEITSKKPVTRRRTVVEVKKVRARDPRFLPLSGNFSGEKFQQHYGFLADSHKSELETLQLNLRRARKLLVSSPQDLFSDRQQEVKRLELAVKRAESIVNNDKRNKVEREALVQMARKEKDKQKAGKAKWWLKGSEKRELLVRARYEALVVEGGKKAVKKAIGKKQKKLGQQEKKSRPFFKESYVGPQQHRKRGPNFASRDGERLVEKRRKLE